MCRPRPCRPSQPPHHDRRHCHPANWHAGSGRIQFGNAAASASGTLQGTTTTVLFPVQRGSICTYQARFSGFTEMRGAPSFARKLPVWLLTIACVRAFMSLSQVDARKKRRRKSRRKPDETAR